MFGAFPLWARARSGRNSALFHVEHFPFRLPFPNCSTWNKTLHHPSNSDPTTPLSSSIRSESQNGPLRSRPLSRPHLPPWRTLRPYLPAHHPGSSRPGAPTLLSGCGFSSNTTTRPADSHPAPAGQITATSLSPYRQLRRIQSAQPAPASPTKKPHQRMLLLTTASNADLIGVFKRIQPSVLRIRENSVDMIVSTTSDGSTSLQVASADGAALAAIPKAAG